MQQAKENINITFAKKKCGEFVIKKRQKIKSEKTSTNGSTCKNYIALCFAFSTPDYFISFPESFPDQPFLFYNITVRIKLNTKSVISLPSYVKTNDSKDVMCRSQKG